MEETVLSCEFILISCGPNVGTMKIRSSLIMGSTNNIGRHSSETMMDLRKFTKDPHHEPVGKNRREVRELGGGGWKSPVPTKLHQNKQTNKKAEGADDRSWDLA